MELEVIIKEKVDNLVSSGAIDKMIENHLSKSIDSALDDLLRSYSDFGKQLKEAIGKKLTINLDNLNIDSYTAMICRIIEDKMNGSVLELHKERIKKHVEDTLEQIKKKHWLLSEVVLKYRESLFGEDTKVDLEYKEETYGNYIHLGERSLGSRYGITSKSHDLTIHLESKNNNKVFAVTNHGRNITPLSDKPHSWEVFLMQLWVNECTIEIDEDTAQMVAEREEDY